MKKILLLTCMLVAGLCITSCSKDDIGSNDDNLYEKLVGLWIETEDYNDGVLEKYSGNEFGYFYEFYSDKSIVQLETIGRGCSFSNGYVYGVKRNDLEYDSPIVKYEIIDNVIWAAKQKFGKIVFQGNDKFKIEWAEDAFTKLGDYSIYERVKGFK